MVYRVKTPVPAPATEAVVEAPKADESGVVIDTSLFAQEAVAVSAKKQPKKEAKEKKEKKEKPEKKEKSEKKEPQEKKKEKVVNVEKKSEKSEATPTPAVSES